MRLGRYYSEIKICGRRGLGNRVCGDFIVISSICKGVSFSINVGALSLTCLYTIRSLLCGLVLLHFNVYVL